jgi:hypothetical protein
MSKKNKKILAKGTRKSPDGKTTMLLKVTAMTKYPYVPHKQNTPWTHEAPLESNQHQNTRHPP